MGVNEIRIIPFPGKPLEYDSLPAARSLVSAPRHGFTIGPENYLLEPVVRWAVEGNLPGNQLPILFYGPSGCGKSHLLQGIFAAWQKNRTGESSKHRGYLLSAVDFARLFSEALETKTAGDFQRRYREAEILLIDDLDRIDDKCWALDELRHTLDRIVQNGGTVVFASTDAPVDSEMLSPAFKNRLIGGTTVPIFLPGYAARRRFLAELASAFRVSLSGSVLDTAARELPLSIPALYGMFAQIYFEASTTETKINARYFLDFLLGRREKRLPGIDAVAKRTARHFSLKLVDLRGKSRNKTVALARSVAVYLIRRQTRAEIKEIARYFGNRDPSTIRHLIDRIEKELARDPELREHLFRLEKE